MLRTFQNLQQVDGGFDPKGVMTMSVALPGSAYADEAARDFWTDLQERLAASPGIESAALSSTLPPVIEGFGWVTPIEGFVPVAGGPLTTQPRGNELVPVIDYYQVVSSGYFDTLKINLIDGRPFDARDDRQGQKVAIVNQTLARAVWGNESALGRRILPTIDREWYTIIGVVADVKNGGIDQPTGTAIYLPHTQVPAATSLLRAPYIAVRSAVAPPSIVSGVRRALGDIDPTLPLARVRTMNEIVSAAQSRPRFIMLVLTLFAGIALVLAAAGIYGVIAYFVAQRTREFGIRMALGARQSSVLRLVLGRGILLAGSGVLIGIGGAIVLTRFLSGFLYQVTATDPGTLAFVSLLLGVVAIFACYVAARRATKVDPLMALRSE